MSKQIAIVGGGIAGVGAAWALHRAGYEVDLFEKASALGGNAKTFRWSADGGHVDSPLLVVAWPQMYYHNYELLLDELGVGIETLPISYFVQTPEGHFCQDGQTGIQKRFAPELRRWKKLVAFVTKVNDFFLPKGRHHSLYHFSYFNPLNLIPLYWMARLFGISRAFWDTIFVPIHCATFITTSMRGVPAVILPLLESIVPLEEPTQMGTWQGAPRQVFDRMTARFSDRVHTDHEITGVERRNDRFVISDSKGRRFEADEVVFACDSASVLSALEAPSGLQRLLLSNAQYVDDVDPAFSSFVVHSDTSILPEKHRQRILSEFNTYSEINEAGALECTFVISAQNPSTKDAGVPMLVTFNSQRVIEKVQKRIDLPHPTHSVSLQNLIIMSMMRYLQGRDGLHYCGTFTTPEGGHDLSFMSGLVVAHAIGADYPFSSDQTDAVADFKQMQKMMLKSGARRPL
ncbi:MAG: NAD(P)-binding protein [Myxococcales bacterium]|nr:NAD(P)-binding protein [Deltaproteobacteria bacterium]NNE17519.1 NAD(P)-binding protein [Myxococcales bacterium]